MSASEKQSEKLNVLFLCTGNSCRSQMAEGWTRYLQNETINAYSAGIEPHGLDPKAVEVMAEAGVDISKHKSRHIDEFKDTDIDFVITVCAHAHESCPVFPTALKVIHAGFEDPPRMAQELAETGASEDEQLDCYRKVRDEIKAFVGRLPETLAIIENETRY